MPARNPELFLPVIHPMKKLLALAYLTLGLMTASAFAQASTETAPPAEQAVPAKAKPAKKHKRSARKKHRKHRKKRADQPAQPAPVAPAGQK